MSEFQRGFAAGLVVAFVITCAWAIGYDQGGRPSQGVTVNRR